MKLDRGCHVMFVEGSDDLFVIANLLEAEVPGIVLDKFIEAPRAAVGDNGAVGAAIRSFVNEVAIQKKERIALVVDANGDIEARRAAIRNALAEEGFHVTGDLSFFPLQTSGRFAGVWLMPDNLGPGSLEEFLWPMVDVSPLSTFAIEATSTAKKDKNAPFRDEAKARVRTWLAWQEQPGLPPGEAVKRRLFTTAQAANFLGWFTKLFAPPAT